MNLSKPLSSTSRRIHALLLRSLFHLPRQQSATFDNSLDTLRSKIGPIFVINLDRQPSRWTDMLRELGRLLDSQGVPLSNRVVRYSACDAQELPPELPDGSMVLPFYTLGDQLFVEPQPDAVPDAFVFRPERGLWYLSGYVLSKKGAQALLDLLPCRGPVDLWINHKFRKLDVRALRRSVVSQRRDLRSTNTYSILPALSRIGILDNRDAALFHGRPIHSPVFAFGSQGSGLSSLAMALSMLGYRCCSDFESVPEVELESLLAGRTDCVFDAYFNIGSLAPHIHTLVQRYPRAKFIVMDDIEKPYDPNNDALLAALEGADLLHLRLERTDGSKWRDLCGHLKLAPPSAQYPYLDDMGLRKRQRVPPSSRMLASSRRLRHDPSPWIASSKDWSGISVSPLDKERLLGALRVCFEDDLAQIQSGRWLLRNDTFPGNLGLFRPANVKPAPGGGLSLSVIEEPLGVRNLSAAAISSCADVLYGRFEATLQATNVVGLVTGFFLHRDSPRQAYGQLCPRRIGHNPFELRCFCVFGKLDLCHRDRPYFARTVCIRTLRRELLLSSIAMFLSLQCPVNYFLKPVREEAPEKPETYEKQSNSDQSVLHFAHRKQGNKKSNGCSDKKCAKQNPHEHGTDTPHERNFGLGC